MNRTQKAETVKTLAERLKKSKAFVLAEYKGLTVSQLTSLRRKLHTSKGSVSVIKNRLFKRALKEMAIENLDQHLAGATALATTEFDPVAIAKALVEFAKENDKLKIKAGFMDSQALTAKMIDDLARLPSREVLLARALASMNAPATNLVMVLSAIPRQLVTVLNALKEKKQ